MNQIQVLSQKVADQIAAGEVAERPSAVVKELVENAMDAGARRISVEIKKGGISYIRVTDDGSGIPAEQVETAFLRHATSKLSAIEDLDRISTMGFRGEALASICAVAEVEVITKTRDAEEGCYLELIHGKPSGKEPIACADGTTMVVKKLFANVPARMKFLKKDATEAGYVADVLGRIALSRPDIAFTYINDGKEIFATGGDGKLTNVVLKLYGLDHAKAVLPVDYTEEHIHISGLIGKPELARGNRTRQTLFVNGRYVKNHVISKVAEEAFRNTIMVGRFPFFVISVAMPAEQVDVNVHPAKTEIKFANEKQIYEIAYRAIRNAIYREPSPQPSESAKVPSASSAKPESQVTIPASGHQNGEMSVPAGEPRQRNGFDRPKSGVTPSLVKQYMEYTIPKKEPEMIDTEFANIIKEEIPTRESKASRLQEPAPPEMAEQTAVQTALPGFSADESGREIEETRVIGQVFDTYIVCQKGDAMFLIDQHATHERLRFERLREAYLNRERLSQMLLSPMVLNLDYREKHTVLEYISDFRSFGFELEDFGGNAVIVRGTPVAADQQTIRDLILELAEAMQEQRRHPVADFEERALDMISCKYAIKANKRLNLQEMQDLVRRTEAMEKTGVKTCPHGRPVRITFTKTELEKMFKRKL